MAGQGHDNDVYRGFSPSHTLTTEDLTKAAALSNAAEGVYAPISVALNANTFGDVLDLAKRLHLNCLTQKCEDILAREDFELTTGRSTTDTHSVVRWAHIAQKYHLVALRLRCERFMCENFHKILDDPLLHDLTRHSLLRMLRAQSAMVSVYKQHVACTQNWGLARAGAHGASMAGSGDADACTGESDNYSALDMDTSSDLDSAANTDCSDGSDAESACDEVSDSSSDSDTVTSRRTNKKSTALLRCWSVPGFPDPVPEPAS